MAARTGAPSHAAVVKLTWKPNLVNIEQQPMRTNTHLMVKMKITALFTHPSPPRNALRLGTHRLLPTVDLHESSELYRQPEQAASVPNRLLLTHISNQHARRQKWTVWAPIQEGWSHQLPPTCQHGVCRTLNTKEPARLGRKGVSGRRCHHLEGVAGADVLQLLGNLGRRSVQLLGQALLLVGVHAVVLLAQISVDHVLHRNETQAGSRARTQVDAEARYPP